MPAKTTIDFPASRHSVEDQIRICCPWAERNDVSVPDEMIFLGGKTETGRLATVTKLIDPAAAEWVRRAFAWFTADGLSYS